MEVAPSSSISFPALQWKVIVTLSLTLGSQSQHVAKQPSVTVQDEPGLRCLADLALLAGLKVLEKP